jgi:hypothetical protein
MAIAWVTGCVVAAVWQVGRAAQGNTLSFMYAIEWPAFAVLGVAGWWALIHAEVVDEQQRSERREFEERMRQESQIARQIDGGEDADLAAYNDHLNELAQRSKRKTWGH